MAQNVNNEIQAYIKQCNAVLAQLRRNTMPLCFTDEDFRESLESEEVAQQYVEISSMFDQPVAADARGTQSGDFNSSTGLF